KARGRMSAFTDGPWGVRASVRHRPFAAASPKLDRHPPRRRRIHEFAGPQTRGWYATVRECAHSSAGYHDDRVKVGYGLSVAFQRQEVVAAEVDGDGAAV